MTSSSKAFLDITLDVLETTRLSPGMVRVALGGPNFDDFPPVEASDAYTKLYFLPEGSDLTPPFDWAAIRQTHTVEQMPSLRTYTIRRYDAAARRIEIDFVTHGDSGLAGPWAAGARPGDRLTMSSPGGSFRPDTTADHILLIGDESAFPAIASVLEAAPSETAATMVLEARSAEHRIEFGGGREIHWVDEVHGHPGAALVDAVTALAWPGGRVQVFAHGERGAMKRLRPVLIDRGVSRQDLSLSAYWAYGRTEDTFQAEKREPIGKIFED